MALFIDTSKKFENLFSIISFLNTAHNSDTKINKNIDGLSNYELQGLEELECITEKDEFYDLKNLKGIETKRDFIQKVYEVIKSHNTDNSVWELTNPSSNKDFNLDEISSSGYLSVPGIKDLIRFVTWTHLQDLDFVNVNDNFIKKQFQSEHPLKENGHVMIISNDVRKQFATQWSNNLLLSYGTGSDIMPSFDFAFKSYFNKKNFKKGTKISIKDFLKDLSKEYPWILQGKIGSIAIEKVIALESLPWWKDDYDPKYVIQPSVAKTLLIAQQEKKIELFSPKDDDNSKNFLLSISNQPIIDLKVLAPNG